MNHGQIVLLNGEPRSGKTSIVREIQERFAGVWMNLGVDHYMAMTPARYLPGIGLRPGGERPDLEPSVAAMYRALYGSIAAHSREGLNVVADVGHHDGYSVPREILPAAARLLRGLPVLFVGVRCPLEEVRRRRLATWNLTASDMAAREPALGRWHEEVHRSHVYDLEVDTARMSSPECADAIQRCLSGGLPRPTVFERIASRDPR